MSVTNNIIRNTQMSTPWFSSKIISSKSHCFPTIDEKGNHLRQSLLDEISFKGVFEAIQIPKGVCTMGATLLVAAV